MYNFKIVCALRGTVWPLIFSKSIILMDFFAREFLLFTFVSVLVLVEIKERSEIVTHGAEQKTCI